jgi:hypothetical protein
MQNNLQVKIATSQVNTQYLGKGLNIFCIFFIFLHSQFAGGTVT